MTRDGVVVPSAIVLSHEEQYDRLADSVPEALSSTVIAGDPCFDRMVASEHQRTRYREALGADKDTTVVVVSSTWGEESLLGQFPDLIAHLLAELPADGYVVAAVLHPNIWFAHGPHQIRLWLGDCLRAGLRLVPPVEGWQQTVIAADVVIGDHGAVTGYAAALGRSTLLAAFPDHQVAPGSAVDMLGQTANRLDAFQSFREQVEAAVVDTTPGRFTEVRELTTSAAGESASLLRKTFYQLMELPEPVRAPLSPQYPAVLIPTIPVTAWWASAEPTSEHEVQVTRWPADVVAREEHPPNTLDRHLVVATNHPRRDLFGNAAIVVLDAAYDRMLDTVFGVRPACVLSVCGNRIAHRDGMAVTITGVDAGDRDVIACASAIYAWLSNGRPWAALPKTFTVHLGHRSIKATLSVG